MSPYNAECLNVSQRPWHLSDFDRLAQQILFVGVELQSSLAEGFLKCPGDILSTPEILCFDLSHHLFDQCSSLIREFSPLPLGILVICGSGTSAAIDPSGFSRSDRPKSGHPAWQGQSHNIE